MTTISRYITQLLEQYKLDKSNGKIPERSRIKYSTEPVHATQDLVITPPLKYVGDRGEGSAVKRLKSLRMELQRVLDMNIDRQGILEDELELFMLTTKEKQDCLKAHASKMRLELKHLDRKLKGVK